MKKVSGYISVRALGHIIMNSMLMMIQQMKKLKKK